MKTAKEWIEEFPVLIPANVGLPLGHPDIEANKRDFMQRFTAFIENIQDDAAKVEPWPCAKHEPDWASLHIETDGGTLYLDLKCKKCGIGGCLGTSETFANSINWETEEGCTEGKPVPEAAL